MEDKKFKIPETEAEEAQALDPYFKNIESKYANEEREKNKPHELKSFQELLKSVVEKREKAINVEIKRLIQENKIKPEDIGALEDMFKNFFTELKDMSFR